MLVQSGEFSNALSAKSSLNPRALTDQSSTFSRAGHWVEGSIRQQRIHQAVVVHRSVGLCGISFKIVDSHNHLSGQAKKNSSP